MSAAGDAADATTAGSPMNGAESLLRTLVASGVEVCFANPGTSEMHLVSAIDRVEGMRPVLGLFEGVVTGMADGYGRMAGRPAATLLHLGPGLANGLANLHNARRAASPIVNIVGDHATYHAQYDAPLSSDIAGFARPVSGWLHSSTSAGSVAVDGARAVQAARQAPGQVATLIVPADVAWLPASPPADPLPLPGPAAVSAAAVSATVAALRTGTPTAILLRGAALRGDGLVAAGRIAAATGARLFCDTFAPRLERGAGRVVIDRLPYFAEQLVETLAPFGQIVLVGSTPPVAFFAYPGKPSWCSPDGATILHLAHPHEDGVAALEEVAEALDAPVAGLSVAPLQVGEVPEGALDQFTVGAVVARFLPEGAIVSDEAATSGLGPALALATAAPHDVLSLTGGSIGQGLPVAAGAAVACPDRKVVCLHGDGGAMYTVQALWTMARERLDVTTVIFANRSYGILNIELHRVGAERGPKALSMLDIGNPDLDWVSLATGMGVEAVRATTVAEFADAFATAMAEPGPHLIEVTV
jgi:acetolactate synthase I/II/III large subunit